MTKDDYEDNLCDIPLRKAIKKWQCFYSHTSCTRHLTLNVV